MAILETYQKFVKTGIKNIKDMANPIELANTMQKVADSMQPSTLQPDGTHRALTTEERRMTELVARAEVRFCLCVATRYPVIVSLLPGLEFLISILRAPYTHRLATRLPSMKFTTPWPTACGTEVSTIFGWLDRAFSFN